MQNNQIPIMSLVEIVEKSSIYQHILQEIIVNNSKPDQYKIFDSQYNNFYFYELVQRIVVFDFLCVIWFFLCVGMDVFALEWIQRYQCHAILVSALLSHSISSGNTLELL